MITEDKKISRRNFLLTLLAIGGGAFYSGGYITSRYISNAIPSYIEPFRDLELLKLFTEIDTLSNSIGKEYLKTHTPNISKSDILYKLSISSVSDINETNTVDRMSKIIYNDIYNNNYIEINKWLLTKTEVYLCTIYYMEYKD